MENRGRFIFPSPLRERGQNLIKYWSSMEVMDDLGFLNKTINLLENLIRSSRPESLSKGREV